MAVEDALVVAEKSEDVGESVVVGDEREVVVAMAGKIVNLEVVAGLGRFGQRRGMHRIVGRTPLALQVARVGVHSLSFALGGGIDAGHGGGRRHLFMETGGGGEGVVEMRALGIWKSRRVETGCAELAGELRVDQCSCVKEQGSLRTDSWPGRRSKR